MYLNVHFCGKQLGLPARGSTFLGTAGTLAPGSIMLACQLGRHLVVLLPVCSILGTLVESEVLHDVTSCNHVSEVQSGTSGYHG